LKLLPHFGQRLDLKDPQVIVGGGLGLSLESLCSIKTELGVGAVLCRIMSVCISSSLE